MSSPDDAPGGAPAGVGRVQGGQGSTPTEGATKETAMEGSMQWGRVKKGCAKEGPEGVTHYLRSNLGPKGGIRHRHRRLPPQLLVSAQHAPHTDTPLAHYLVPGLPE